MNEECKLADGLAKTPSKVGEVESELARLSDKIETTAKLLTTLCQKLTLITKEECDSVCEEKEEVSICPLATNIRDKWKQVDRSNERIEDLIKRIEL